MIRAFLSASATATSLYGFRASNPANHAGKGTPRFACLIIDVAPTTSRVLSCRLPCFEIDPSFSFPPLESKRGVKPSQAAKSRPVLKPSMSLTVVFHGIGGLTRILMRIEAPFRL